MLCTSCRTRHFDLAITDTDLARLYADYRGEAYFRQRHQFEPWYTRAMNENLGAEAEMKNRRAVLGEALAECGFTGAFGAVLDHGGDRGQMLLDLSSPLKAVYEISGVTPEPGVTSIDHAAMTARKSDLILSCHVLEHLPAPTDCVAELAALDHAGTVYFFEVPDEAFKSFQLNTSNLQQSWIGWLTKHPALFKLMDFASTSLRIKLRLVPPLFFVTLREHLTYFSIAGLARMLQDNGLSVLSARIRANGHIGIVAIKP
jgi:hypothetical protein